MIKVVMANNVRVENPPSEVAHALIDKYTITNPDYYRLERLGKWTGNTPEKLAMWERDGKTLILPYGAIVDVMSALTDAGYGCGVEYDMSYGDRKYDYGSSINLYEYQQKAVQAAMGALKGILVAPCGSGKTQMGLAIAAKLGLKTLWLTHTHDLLNQSMSRAKQVFGLKSWDYGTITAGKVEIGSVITFATVQTMAKLDLSQYRDTWGCVIVDECFPGNAKILTLNGEKELQSLKNGDIVASCNLDSGRIEYKPVLHTFKNIAHDIVSIKMSSGKEIVCTSNHPFFTKRGWVMAGDLNETDYVLRNLRQKDKLGRSVEVKLLQGCKQRLRILFKRMFNGRSGKGQFFEWRRVESVSVLEQTGDGTFGGLCSDGYVYNIEVADNNNYFVDGVLVHNCHHVAGTPTKLMQFSKVIGSLNAAYKFGLTATPKRADGLVACMYAYLGPKFWEISREEVGDKTCPVEYMQIPTGFDCDYGEFTNPDGTLNYVGLINAVCQDADRNRQIARVIDDILQIDGSRVLVLSERVSHLEKLATELVGMGANGSPCSVISGKTKKSWRDNAITKLKSGQSRLMFATYQLAKEGLDIPELTHLILASPNKTETVITQAVGRVARACEGKKRGVVVDFVDGIFPLSSWASKRERIYKKLGYKPR